MAQGNTKSQSYNMKELAEHRQNRENLSRNTNRDIERTNHAKYHKEIRETKETPQYDEFDIIQGPEWALSKGEKEWNKRVRSGKQKNHLRF